MPCLANKHRACSVGGIQPPERYARQAREKRQRRVLYQPGAQRQETEMQQKERAESPIYKCIGRVFSPCCQQFILPSAARWAGILRAFGTWNPSTEF
jgi:hypothetical protein